MKNFAFIIDKTVTNIVVAEDKPLDTELGIYLEYNDVNPAVIGSEYDSANNAFIAPKPYDSWVLDENYNWIAPEEKPEGFYRWDEQSLSWVEMVN